MRTILMTVTIGFFSMIAKGQTSYSPIYTKLEIIKENNELSCSSQTVRIRFPINRNLSLSPKNNFVSIDGQIIQIMLLNFGGNVQNGNAEVLSQEKEILESYSKDELGHFKSNLGIEVINPNSQWVIIKNRSWFIWYFKIGNPSKRLDKKTEIQLFATTVIGSNILTINAPIFSFDYFTKAGTIVNDLMVAFTLINK